MSWFTRLFARARSQDEPTSSRLHFVGRTQAGIYVDPDRALRNAVVWACVNYLCRSVGQLPWHVMQARATSGADRAIKHPVDWLINTRPCADMGSFNWRQSMLGTALLWGNAYAEIEFDLRGVPVALWPVHASRVGVHRGGDGRLLYRVDGAVNGGVELEASEMFHLRGFGDGPVGLGVVEYAAQSIGWAQATELFGSSFFGEGMNPAGVIETPTGLSVGAMQALRKELENLYKGPRKAHRTAILDAGMKWTKISSNPQESQFVEVRQHQVAEICRWFGVPPHKVQDLTRSTFSNIENQAIEVVVDTITPWVKAFEQEADYKLFGQNRVGFFTKMNLNGLLRGDSASRAQFYKAMRELGVLSVNEIRALEDLNPIGKLGELRVLPANMVSLERIANPPDPPAAPSSADAGEPAMPSDGNEPTAKPPKPNGRQLPN